MFQDSGFPAPHPRWMVWSGGGPGSFIFLWFLKHFEGKAAFCLGFSLSGLPGMHFPLVLKDFASSTLFVVRSKLQFMKSSLPTPLRNGFRNVNNTVSAI